MTLDPKDVNELPELLTLAHGASTKNRSSLSTDISPDVSLNSRINYRSLNYGVS